MPTSISSFVLSHDNMSSLNRDSTITEFVAKFSDEDGVSISKAFGTNGMNVRSVDIEYSEDATMVRKLIKCTHTMMHTDLRSPPH